MPDGNSQTKAEWRTRHALQRVTAKSDSIDVNSGLLRTVIAPPAAAPPQGQARGGQFGEAVEDAYSVYASFGTGSKASNSGPSVDIGEVFATGDAAVQLAEGINYYSSRAGNAAMVNAVSTCIQQVSAAKAAGVDMSKIPSCDTTELASASNPAPTLTAISPTSANGPAARAAAVTVTVTLSGGGFGQTSKLNIMGNPGVTAGILKPSADGTSMSVDLTLAPGTAKSPASLSVVNPAPGGGTSATVTFTVM